MDNYKNYLTGVVRKFEKDGKSFTKMTISAKYVTPGAIRHHSPIDPDATEVAKDGKTYPVKYEVRVVGGSLPEKEGVYRAYFNDGWIDERAEYASRHIIRVKAPFFEYQKGLN